MPGDEAVVPGSGVDELPLLVGGRAHRSTFDRARQPAGLTGPSELPPTVLQASLDRIDLGEQLEQAGMEHGRHRRVLCGNRVAHSLDRPRRTCRNTDPELAQAAAQELRPDGTRGQRIGGLGEQPPELRMVPAERVAAAVAMLTDSGTQPAHYFAGPAQQTLLLAGTGGFGLLARAGDLLSRQRGGKSFLSLEADEKPLPGKTKNTKFAVNIVIYALTA